MKSIVVKLKGQLCNQLFQYAFARSLQLQFGGQITLYQKKSILWFVDPSEIDIFNFLPKGLVDTCNVCSISTEIYIQLKRLKYPFKAISALFSWTLLSDNAVLANIDFSNYKKVILDGYFMSNTWFDTNNEIIKAEYNTYLELKASKNIKDLHYTDTLTIHIRLGDYLSDKWVNTHYVCGPKYFENAIKYFIDNKYMFSCVRLVSDDINTLKSFGFIANLELISPRIEIVQRTLYDDMYIISKSPAVVMSNSTFSWWGIFLNDSVHLNVLSPLIWHHKNPEDYENLYDHSWCRIPII